MTTPTMRPQEQLHPAEGTRFTRWGGFQGFRYGFIRLFAIGANINPWPFPGFGIALLGFHFGVTFVPGVQSYVSGQIGFPFFSFGFMRIGPWWDTSAAVEPVRHTDEDIKNALRRNAAKQMLDDDREHTTRCRPGYCDSAAHRERRGD